MVFVVCCLLYSTELAFRPAPPCMLYLPRRVLICTPAPCCYMCWFFPRPLQIISRPSNPHRQLWLDGFQGRSLALDKVLDGYMSVVDWPVAQFYKARFSCNIKLILLYICICSRFFMWCDSVAFERCCRWFALLLYSGAASAGVMR